MAKCKALTGSAVKRLKSPTARGLSATAELLIYEILTSEDAAHEGGHQQTGARKASGVKKSFRSRHWNAA